MLPRLSYPLRQVSSLRELTKVFAPPSYIFCLGASTVSAALGVDRPVARNGKKPTASTESTSFRTFLINRCRTATRAGVLCEPSTYGSFTFSRRYLPNPSRIRARRVRRGTTTQPTKRPTSLSLRHSLRWTLYQAYQAYRGLVSSDLDASSPARRERLVTRVR